MPVKPKIKETMVETLRDCYVVRKMSTTDIANKSESLFGKKLVQEQFIKK